MVELELRNVSYQYEKDTFSVQELNWKLHRGEIHCWLGRSGSGKTTLLQLAAGLKQPTGGKVLHQDVPVEEPLSDIGFVFQDATLLQWKKVIDNILLPIQLKRKITEEDIAYAKALLEMLQIQHLFDRYPSTLSGGQKSRVAIVRALVTKPTLLFCDEPFAALDLMTKEELQNELLYLNQSKNIAMLFVTHDVSEAAFLADQIGVMEKGAFIYRQQAPDWSNVNSHRRDTPLFRDYCMDIRQSLEETAHA